MRAKLLPMNDGVDWNMAAKIGTRLVPPGPRLTADERAAAVQRLRRAAGRAIELVAQASRLPGAPAAVEGVTLVVDRPGIIWANAAMLTTVFCQQETGQNTSSNSFWTKLGGHFAGSGAGLVLAVTSTHVMGQYEPVSRRLLLNAPTVETVRRAIGADPDDFALWVCLHEQTHRQQFAAAPWLRDYLMGLMRRVAEVDEPASPAKLARADKTDEKPGKDGGPGPDETAQHGHHLGGHPAGLGLLGVLTPPDVASSVDDAIAVMSLLEGYADMLMDAAGAAVIPSLATIRRAVDARRDPNKRDLKTLLERALGLTAKVDQYIDGKFFCEAVCRQVGLDGLNVAFSSREALPSRAELRRPEAWVTRQFGPAGPSGTPKVTGVPEPEPEPGAAGEPA